jgi:hypothetical protein
MSWSWPAAQGQALQHAAATRRPIVEAEKVTTAGEAVKAVFKE